MKKFSIHFDIFIYFAEEEDADFWEGTEKCLEVFAGTFVGTGS
jgi:hypothetical protein